MLCLLSWFVFTIDMEKEQFKLKVLPLREKLTGHAYRILETPEDVEDVIQEVFLKLWYIREKLDNYTSIEALAVTMTKNACLNKTRIYRTHREVALSESTAELGCDDNPHKTLEHKDELNHLMTILDRLPGLQQTILRMKHVDGFEIAEISELIGSTPENVRVNLSRARKRVKELFFLTK